MLVCFDVPIPMYVAGLFSSFSSFLVFQESLLKYTSKPLYKRINNGEGLPFQFTDLYGKLTLKSKGGSKFSAFGFHNRDNVDYQIAEIDWKQSGGGINFLLVPSSSPIFIKGHVNGSSFDTEFNEFITDSGPKY